jgi:putative intracellular protease/amidase
LILRSLPTGAENCGFRLDAGKCLRRLLMLCIGLAALCGLLGSSPARAASETPIAAAGVEAIAPYRPRVGHARPVVAVVGEIAGTELTDYAIPYGILSQSAEAEVVALGTGPGPMHMDFALKIQPQATIDEFDKRFPEGADYVIVPAVHHPDAAALIAWVRAQAAKGAVIVGVCDGVWVLANAGLLKGHRATGHWYSLDALEHKFRDTTWVRNRRYVADGSIVTTTGVTASIPVSLALVEAIAGPQRAAKVARQVGALDWSTAHDSNEFGFDTRIKLTAAGNVLFFWRHEVVGLRITPGTDEIALALIADAYSRTKRAQAVAVSDSKEAVRTREGLLIVPDAAGSASSIRMLRPPDSKFGVRALDWALDSIAERYGPSTANFVAEQMEYRRR